MKFIMAFKLSQRALSAFIIGRLKRDCLFNYFTSLKHCPGN